MILKILNADFTNNYYFQKFHLIFAFINFLELKTYLKLKLEIIIQCIRFYYFYETDPSK